MLTTVRISKAVWFLSLLAALGGLLYAYASFPETIQLNNAANGPVQTIERNQLFYAALGMLALFNAMVFVVNRIMPPGDGFFQVWFYGLIVFFNVFILVSLQFFNLFNSQERFDYDSIGFIIYGSVAMIILWASLWPLVRLIQVIRFKQPVGNN